MRKTPCAQPRYQSSLRIPAIVTQTRPRRKVHKAALAVSSPLQVTRRHAAQMPSCTTIPDAKISQGPVCRPGLTAAPNNSKMGTRWAAD